MTSQIIYKGELRTSATHIQSGTVIETDAPTDNQGKGERFSPTDLVGVALATCMVTTMALKARTLNIELNGARLDVTKIMASNPRRIDKLVVAIVLPDTLVLEQKELDILENTARTCPVAKSLHQDVQVEFSMTYPAGGGTIATV